MNASPTPPLAVAHESTAASGSVTAMAEEARRTAATYLECFSTDAGARVLEHVRTHVFRPRRHPREGMTMQETAVFTLGEQSLYHTLLHNIEHGRKVKQHD